MSNPKLKLTEYQCARCGGIFKKGWSDEEALAEKDKLWDVPTEDCAVICNECFNEIHPDNHLELAREYGYKK